VSSHIGLLVVHGIGAQKRGESLAKLAQALERADKQATRGQTGDAVVLRMGEKSVHLYEVYWADILKEVTCGAFQMKEVQSLCWFPWFNFRSGNYRPGSYSFLKLVWWWIVLPIFNFLFLFAYYGAGLFAQMFLGAEGKRERPPTDNELTQAARKVLGHGTTLTAVDRILDEYAGDIFSYVNSAGKAFYRDTGEPVPPALENAYAGTVQRFYDQLLKADADGCATIQIVAHSLGTVVTYHALSDFGIELAHHVDGEAIRAAKAKVTRLHTIGSPLEKIRFFWPRITPSAVGSGEMKLRWDNYVSFFDPVSGMLTSFDDWGAVANHRLLGGGFFRGHIVYEHHRVFLAALTEGLCGHSVPFDREPWERFRNWVLLIGETLVAPVLLAAVLAVGAALFAVAALLIPYLFSLILRLFLPREIWGVWIDTLTLIFLSMMSLAFFIAPRNRAKKVHSLYWMDNRNAGSKPV
jgi:hypothetical protein